MFIAVVLSMQLGTGSVPADLGTGVKSPPLVPKTFLLNSTT